MREQIWLRWGRAEYDFEEATVVGECRDGTPFAIPATVDQLKRWHGGAFVQDAFPELAADQREILISGTSPAAFEAMFSSEEDTGGGEG